MSDMNVVMYHYVRPTPDRPPEGYYHLSLDDFRRQLDYFEETFGLVDRESFIGFLQGEQRVPSGIVLTFDDALIDHHKWVLPELQRRGLWGVFFVPTGPFTEAKLLPVHRIHALIGSVPAAMLRQELEVVLNDSPNVLNGAETVDDAYDNQSSEGDVSDFKRLLNFVVSPTDVHEVLSRLEERLSGYETPTVSQYYSSPEQLRELADAGMILGAHSVTHPVLSRLNAEAQIQEISESIRWLEEQVGSQPVSTFAYPYGGAETFTRQTLEIVADAGCVAAFTTESGVVTDEKYEKESFVLPRRDCNEFKYGGATFNLP